MAIAVEDGTGLSTADSYVSVADADAYNLIYNTVTAGWADLNDATCEQRLKVATQVIDLFFQERFVGYKGSETQALAWPRTAGYNTDGYAIDGNVVPTIVKNATIEMAFREQVVGGTDTATGATTKLIPDVANPGSVESKEVGVGSLKEKTTYLGGQSQIKWFRKIELMLKPLLAMAGSVERA